MPFYILLLHLPQRNRLVHAALDCRLLEMLGTHLAPAVHFFFLHSLLAVELSLQYVIAHCHFHADKLHHVVHQDRKNKRSVDAHSDPQEQYEILALLLLRAGIIVARAFNDDVLSTVV